MQRRTSRRPTLIDQVLPIAFLALSIIETFFEIAKIGWGRSFIRTLLVIILAGYFEHKTRGIQTQFRQFFLYGFLATLMAEIISIFSDDQGVFILYLIVNAVAYFLFAYAFTMNIIDGKVSTGLPLVLAFSMPFVLIGIIVYILIKDHLDYMKIFVVIYMVLLYAMGIQSAVRNFNTNKKSFMPALMGGAGLVISESLLLITHFLGGKWPIVFAIIVFVENLARFGLLKGAVAHIEYFDVEGKGVVGESLFGGKIKTRPKEM